MSAAALATITESPATRQRKDLVPPKVVSSDMTLFDYLVNCQPPADQKLIDIACSHALVPPELRKDAAQEIRIIWANLRPDTDKFKPGQIAAYAHRMACHAALKLRRDLGAAVRLPGSAFRKKKDGTTYVTPGVLANALDWNAMESWFQTDGGDGMGGEAPAAGAGIDQPALDGLSALIGTDGEPSVEEDEEDIQRTSRLEKLEAARDELTPTQFRILESMIQGSSVEELMLELNIKRGVLMREIAVSSSVVALDLD